MSVNPETFHLNVFLESTPFKTRKNLLYGSLVVSSLAVGAWLGRSWLNLIRDLALLACVMIALAGTSIGKFFLSQLSRCVPWTKFGYMTLKIVGCEPFFEETSPNLFLHKSSAVGQIVEWIKYKAKTKGAVDLFWAGHLLDATKTLPVGVVHGSSLIAVLHQEKMDEPLQLGQDNDSKAKVIRSTNGVPTDPDFDFDPEEFNVPSFIREMNDEDDAEDGVQRREPQSQQMQAIMATVSANLRQLYNRIVNVSKQLFVDFGDSRWCHAEKSQVRTHQAPVNPPPPPVEESDDESDSDMDYDEAPSFIREMNSIDDDDDDDDDEEEAEQGPSYVTIAVEFVLQLFTSLKKASIKKFQRARATAWRKVTGFIRVFKIADSSTIRLSKARDMITLDDDEDQVRFEMPCGDNRHSMSQSSLMQYMKNQVLVEKNHQISCPSQKCSGAWSFGTLRDILQQTHDCEFTYSEEDVSEIEKALSANFIAKEVNCQRCPQCQLVLSRNPGTESYSMECFGCGWVFCWCCRTPWDTESDSCLNPKCTSAWRFVASQMLENCPRKHLDHMANVPTLRACPTCGQLITHVQACKHMNCSLCKTRFCFICMQPQKNGNWQCGYDVNSCKLCEVQRLDSLADERIVRSDVLEQLSPELFKKQAAANIEEFRKQQEEFMANVMASVRSQEYFN